METLNYLSLALPLNCLIITPPLPHSTVSQPQKIICNYSRELQLYAIRRSCIDRTVLGPRATHTTLQLSTARLSTNSNARISINSREGIVCLITIQKGTRSASEIQIASLIVGRLVNYFSAIFSSEIFPSLPLSISLPFIMISAKQKQRFYFDF